MSHHCMSSSSSCKVKVKDEIIIILIHELEYCWAISTFSPHATFRALSTLLIFEGSRILGYSGPLVNSIWVSDFNELDFIPSCTLSPSHFVKLWLDILELEQCISYKVRLWELNYSSKERVGWYIYSSTVPTLLSALLKYFYFMLLLLLLHTSTWHLLLLFTFCF